MKNPYPFEDKKVLLCPWCQHSLDKIKEFNFKYYCYGCKKTMIIELE